MTLGVNLLLRDEKRVPDKFRCRARKPERLICRFLSLLLSFQPVEKGRAKLPLSRKHRACIAYRGEEPLLLLGFSSRGLIFTAVVVRGWGLNEPNSGCGGCGRRFRLFRRAVRAVVAIEEAKFFVSQAKAGRAADRWRLAREGSRPDNDHRLRKYGRTATDAANGPRSESRSA